MADTRFTVTYSPDMAEIMDYAISAIGRLVDHVDDPRVREVFAEFLLLTDPMKTGSFSEQQLGVLADIDMDRKPMLIPGDGLLKLVAKMRAVERVVC